MPPLPTALALDLDALEALRDEFDAHAAQTAGVDAFCSTTDWAVPAQAAFLPGRTPRVARFGDDAGFAAFMERLAPDGARLWMPFEIVWGLGSPLVGAHAVRLADEAARWLAATPGWDVVVVTGIARDAPLWSAWAEAASRFFHVGVGVEPLRRCLVDLGGGVEGLLSRRSRNFRRGVLRARQAAADAGLTFEVVDGGSAAGPPLWQRVLAVEARSWKGLEGSGLAAPEMRAFYGEMVPRLAARGRLDLTFARDEARGVDAGYLLGARFAGAYRGLQFSYDDAYAALGLGNALQLHAIERAASLGLASYDLGAEVDYKLRWCDRVVEAPPLVVRR